MVTTWAISKTRETDEFMIVTRTAEIYLKWSPIQLLLLHSQPLRNFHSLQSLSDSSKFSKNISESFIIIWQSPLPDLLMKLNGENENTLDIPLTAEDLTFSSFRVECSHQIYNLAESLQYKSWKRNLRCPTEDSTFRSSVTTEMEINIARFPESKKGKGQLLDLPLQQVRFLPSRRHHEISRLSENKQILNWVRISSFRIEKVERIELKYQNAWRKVATVVEAIWMNWIEYN